MQTITTLGEAGMPVSFDFLNTGAPVSTLTTGPNTLFNTDLDNSGGGQSVRFTVSSDAPGELEAIVFGNSVTAVPLALGDVDSLFVIEDDDVFTLSFVDTANPVNTQISGTADNQIAVQFGGNLDGSVLMELLSGTAVVGSTTVTTEFSNGSVAFNAASINAIRFTTLTDDRDQIVLAGLTGNALNCFLAGTMLATPDGAAAVETLATGDRVLTADGRAVEVRWVGTQFVDLRVARPEKVNPICISAGALAHGVPERDLYVSPDHAVGMEGYLVNASVLVNGSTIYQVALMPLEGFCYYHVETDAHELLLAEGCPAESFIDREETNGFDNAGERVERLVEEMNLPRISSRRLLPEMLAAKLMARADVIRDRRLAG